MSQRQPNILDISPGELVGCCLFCHVVYPSGKPEDFRFCVAEGSNQSSLFELRPDKVKNYDFPLGRLDSDALWMISRSYLNSSFAKGRISISE